jgi:hypothetical protein
VRGTEDITLGGEVRGTKGVTLGGEVRVLGGEVRVLGGEVRGTEDVTLGGEVRGTEDVTLDVLRVGCPILKLSYGDGLKTCGGIIVRSRDQIAFPTRINNRTSARFFSPFSFLKDLSFGLRARGTGNKIPDPSFDVLYAFRGVV